MVLTKLEYLRRFTQGERIAIRAAAANSPELTDYLELLKEASEVDTEDTGIIDALMLLEATQLIQVGRKNDILSNFTVLNNPAEAQPFIPNYTINIQGTLCNAMSKEDSTVIFEDGRWSTLEALVAMGAVLEVI